jgi:hypothetical protein
LPQAIRAPVPHEPVRFRPAAKAVCRPAPAIIENIAAEAEAPPPLPTDDIDRAYADERSAIMLDFTRRLAGAKTPGERRAIKTARKSALAAARQKKKLAKAARKAANAAARQGQPRRNQQRPRPH